MFTVSAVGSMRGTLHEPAKTKITDLPEEENTRAVGIYWLRHTGVADDGGLEVYCHSPVREDVTNFFPSGCGKEGPRWPRKLRCGCHGDCLGGVPAGGGMRAMIISRGVRIPVPRAF